MFRFLLLVLFTMTTLNATLATKKSVTKLYLATFERAPDRAGLDYWLKSGLSLEEIAMSFFDQHETRKKYPDGTTVQTFINSVYSHLFKRTPDSRGFEYWSRELKSNSISKSTFILAVINGALGDDAKILENRTDVALLFVASGNNSVADAILVIKDIGAETEVEDSFSDDSSDISTTETNRNTDGDNSTDETQSKKEAIVSTAPPPQYSKNRIDENFLAWSREYDEDTKLKINLRDTNGTGFTWRGTNNTLVFRMKNHTLLQKNTNITSYLYTIFDSNGTNNPTISIDMSGKDAVIQLDSNFNQNFEYYPMIFDGVSWYLSEESFASKFIEMESISLWKKINESDTLISNLGDSSAKKSPKLTFASDTKPNLSTIQGVGLFYKLKDGKDKSSFTLNNIILDGNFKKSVVYANNYLQKRVSKLLFGLCITPNASRISQDSFINHFKEWVEYLRWPGGSMIEHYDLKNPSTSSRNYFVGEWIEFVREKIPSMEFVVGASASRIKENDKNVTMYGQGLINYLNVEYNKSWGDNPALKNKIGLKYLEVGNEPFFEKISSKEYGDSLTAYAKGVYSVDKSVKLMGPTNINGNIYNHLKDILRDYGGYLDVVNTHHYTDTPEDYKLDIRVIRGYMKKYLRDNDRRKVDDIELSFTEYNSLNVDTRAGIYHSVSWAKVIWHAETFSYLILGGVDMASVWHASMGGGHALYSTWGDYANPLHYAFKFWHKHIDFTKQPKVLYSKNRAKNLIITPIDMKDKIVIFVVNNSPIDNIEDTIEFEDINLGSMATIDTLLPKDTGEKWEALTIANNVNRERLKDRNPDATISDDKITFPKIEVTVKSSKIDITNNRIIYTFPKYTITAITINK